MKLSLLFALPMMMVLSCTGTGPKVSAGVEVAVTPNACHENQAAIGVPDGGSAPNASLIDLSCDRIDGTGSISIQFPREQWNAMRLKAAFPGDAGTSLGK